MLPGPIAAQVVLYNSLWNRQFSGLQLVLAGGKLAPVEAWLDGWENSKAAAVGKGSKFTTALLLAPNNLPFPSSAVPTCGAALPVADLTAVMSAVYGSPAGALVSHKFAPEGRITPCIGTPGRCYGYAHAAVLLLSVVTCDLTLSLSRGRLVLASRGLCAAACTTFSVSHRKDCSLMSKAPICSRSLVLIVCVGCCPDLNNTQTQTRFSPSLP